MRLEDENGDAQTEHGTHSIQDFRNLHHSVCALTKLRPVDAYGPLLPQNKRAQHKPRDARPQLEQRNPKPYWRRSARRRRRWLGGAEEGRGAVALGDTHRMSQSPRVIQSLIAIAMPSSSWNGRRRERRKRQTRWLRRHSAELLHMHRLGLLRFDVKLPPEFVHQVISFRRIREERDV
jgi:hypothetical protein